ncbi:MAG: hypothetical protein ACTSPL_04285 [Candidatus Odinarchaeia archaeon]
MSWDLFVKPFYKDFYRFYIENKEGLCKEPAFIIIPKHHILGEKNRYVLYVSDVAELGKFKTLKEAYLKLRELMQKAKFPIKLWLKLPYRDKLIFFGESEKKEDKR